MKNKLFPKRLKIPVEEYFPQAIIIITITFNPSTFEAVNKTWNMGNFKTTIWDFIDNR